MHQLINPFNEWIHNLTDNVTNLRWFKPNWKKTKFGFINLIRIFENGVKMNSFRAVSEQFLEQFQCSFRSITHSTKENDQIQSI